MPSYEKGPTEIRPAAPDDLLRELLALPLARTCLLQAGDTAGGSAGAEEYLLAAAVKGQVTVTTHDHYFLLAQGQAVVLAAPGDYQLQAVSESLSMVLHLRGELPGRMLGEYLQEGAASFPGGGPMVREVVASLSVLEEESGPVSGAAASAAAYSLLTKLRSRGACDPAGEGIPPLVESAIAIIQEDFPYLEGLDELAQRLEVSKAHLIRCFTKAVGVSPGKYITQVRVEYAKLLLQDEDASVTYVAEASGFANANYFAKVFRRETGMSPSEFLESAPKEPAGRRKDRHPVWAG